MGNPIYPFLGGKMEYVAAGMSIGGQPLVFTYNSAKQAVAIAAGKTAKTFGNMPSLGGLWESSLHRNLIVGTGGFGATLYRGDGHTISFRYSGTAYIPGADMTGTFAAIPSGYRYVDTRSRVVETYNAGGRLTSLADAAGNTLTFSYSSAAGATAPAAGYLLRITDNNGRTLSFAYTLPAGGVAATDGVISSVSDFMGRTLSTGFDTNGNLAQLTWPDTKVRQFLYENASLPWALTGVTDERGIRYSTFAYDAAGRALSTEHAGGVNKYSVSYGTPPQATMMQTYDSVSQLTTRTRAWQAPTGVQLTRPNGEIANASTATVLGHPLPTSLSQPAGSGCAAATSASTFDTNGNLASADDFSGQRSCYAYDAGNREIVRVEGLATTVACTSVLPAGSTLPTGSRKIETTWHADWRLPTKVNEPLLSTSTVYHGQPDPFNSNIVANCTAAVALPNGKPMPLVCKQVEQATLSDGTADPAIPARITSFTYDAAGRLLSSTDASNRITSNAYYGATSFNTSVGDPSFSKVSLLLHGDGANGSIAIPDSSANPKIMTIVATPQVSTTQSKFGGASLFFNGSDAYLTSPFSPDFDFGAGDFTIETWAQLGALPASGAISSLAAKYTAAGDRRSWLFYLMNTGGVYELALILSPNGTSTSGAGVLTKSGSIAVSTGTWYHLAVTRQGGSVRFFVNGVAYGPFTDSTNIFAGTSALTVGTTGDAANGWFNGYLDDLRITKGVARYTASFTPPTQAFPNAGLAPNPNAVGHLAGDLQSTTNSAGHVTQFTLYDMNGRLRQMVDPNGVVTDIVYTPRGWTSGVTVTPPGGAARTTTYTYDNAGQLTTASLPDGSTLGYGYDAAHRLTSVTDAKGNSVTYTLDNLGNKVGEQVKDPQGNLQRNITRVYDALNRLQQVTGASN